MRGVNAGPERAHTPPARRNHREVRGWDTIQTAVVFPHQGGDGGF